MGIREECAMIQESSERQEEILKDLVNQTNSSSDAMELFMQGEHFLRVWDMGNPEGPEEVENVLRRNRRRLGTGSKDRQKEPERQQEMILEAVPDADVDMTLQ